MLNPTPAQHTHRRLCDRLGTLMFQQGHALGLMGRAEFAGDTAEADRLDAEITRRGERIDTLIAAIHHLDTEARP